MKRIAIVGGGVGAMSAAFALTSKPGWRDEYEITVYQHGWRLGGKGATGRGPEGRIEEHGLHIWMGFYNNAFEMMRQCYAELGRPEGAPLATLDQAFRPHHFSVLGEQVDGAWVPWPITMPVTSGVPGVGGTLPTPVQYVEMLLQGMLEAMIGPAHEDAVEKILESHASLAEKLGAVLVAVEQFLATRVEALLGRAFRSMRPLGAWLVEDLHAAHEIFAGRSGRENASAEDRHREVLDRLDRFHARFTRHAAPLAEGHHGVRRLGILLDFGRATIRGILADHLVRDGFVAADDRDFRAWLRSHGASEATVSSAIVREIYDLCFAYENGDLARPNMAAGTALQIALSIALTYKGAVMWKMMGGMGDTIFAPFHQVLERRGVRFEFFHRLTRVGLTADRDAVGTLTFERQATVRERPYRPLIDVKGLPCWPSHPLYDQLAEGERLERENVDLESNWSAWKPVEIRTLERGRDFDDVLLAISLGGLPDICRELVDASPAWRDMVTHVKTVQTQAVQLWFDPTLSDLGWSLPSPVAGTFDEPLDTWADMSEVLDFENWPSPAPKTLFYLCGPLAEAAPPPPPSDLTYPARCKSQVRRTALDWLARNARWTWPTTAVPDPSHLFDLLHASGASGEERFDAQYWRANIDPSERYVLSLAGSTRFRLHPAGSHVSNLFLAGDWVLNPINAGCVEAAVMAGLAAARGLGGVPEKIMGWPDPDPPVLHRRP